MAESAIRIAETADGGLKPPRLESALRIEIVPLRTDEDRRLFGTVIEMLLDIIFEMRGTAKGESDEQLGSCKIGRDRVDNPGAGDLGRPEFSDGQMT